MKYLVIAEDERTVTGFTEMGVDSKLVKRGEECITEVEEAIKSRKYGTLLLSPYVLNEAQVVVQKHNETGTLPFILTLTR